MKNDRKDRANHTRKVTCKNCHRSIIFDEDDEVPSFCDHCLEKDRSNLSRKQSGRRSRKRNTCRSMRQSLAGQNAWCFKDCHGLANENACPVDGKIKYHANTKNIPNICPYCVSRLRDQQATQGASYLRKPCPRCGRTIYFREDGYEFSVCRVCYSYRLLLVPGSSKFFFAKARDFTVAFRFGKCFEPHSSRVDEEAFMYRTWANKGYFWVEFPDDLEHHYLFERSPLRKGFISFWEAGEDPETLEELREKLKTYAVDIFHRPKK